MRLLNTTPFEAELVTAELPDEPETFAALVVKATYDLGPDGELLPSAEQVPIQGGPLATPFGVFHGDRFPGKQGIDLCILGTVRRARPVREVTVSVSVGPFQRALRVMGDRTWHVRGLLSAKPTPSDPEPFTEMPLAYSRAYGGKTEGPYGQVAWSDNPDGIGYYLTMEHAIGRPLPNIEPAGGPFIQAWDDRPEVIGFGPYPMFWGLRARGSVHFNPAKDKITSIDPSLFNNAHPAMILPAVAPSEAVRLTGLTEAKVAFHLPSTRPAARVTVGTTERMALGKLDSIYLFADAGKVVLIHRIKFRYVMTPGEARQVKVISVRRKAKAEAEREAP